MNYKKLYTKLTSNAQQNPLPTLSIDGAKRDGFDSRYIIKCFLFKAKTYKGFYWSKI